MSDWSSDTDSCVDYSHLMMQANRDLKEAMNKLEYGELAMREVRELRRAVDQLAVTVMDWQALSDDHQRDFFVET